VHIGRQINDLETPQEMLRLTAYAGPAPLLAALSAMDDLALHAPISPAGQGHGQLPSSTYEVYSGTHTTMSTHRHTDS